MTSLSLPCPAKINLFLEVHDRRADGYHDIGTLFQTLSIGDHLQGELSDDLTLVGAENVTPDVQSNLVIRAARLLREKAKDRLAKNVGLRFTLSKILPAGAGLGGGSSDAASALRIANQLWDLNYSTHELSILAQQLGADIPFFLMGGTAFGEGKGEILKPAPQPFPFHVVVATPHCHVETAWAYQNLDAVRPQHWQKFKALYHTYCEDAAFYRILRNDFEAPMLKHFPPIAQIHEILSRFEPSKVLLSGSGASVFGLFTEKTQAQSALDVVQRACRFSALTEFSH